MSPWGRLVSAFLCAQCRMHLQGRSPNPLGDSCSWHMRPLHHHTPTTYLCNNLTTQLSRITTLHDVYDYLRFPFLCPRFLVRLSMTIRPALPEQQTSLPYLGFRWLAASCLLPCLLSKTSPDEGGASCVATPFRFDLSPVIPVLKRNPDSSNFPCSSVWVDRLLTFAASSGPLRLRACLLAEAYEMEKCSLAHGDTRCCVG
jgi:hypothetical protein